MLRPVHNTRLKTGEGELKIKNRAESFAHSLVFILYFSFLVFISACSSTDRHAVDKLNSIAYAYRYRNLDSTKTYAERAMQMSNPSDDGYAEARNHLAFVSTMLMDYEDAYGQLEEVEKNTDNQIELLVADIQYMRLCQRMSRNREFYDYRERANKRMRRISEERHVLTERQKKRMVYAETEYAIVSSAYYYYVGLERQSIEELMAINPAGEIQGDTAQFLNYLYNIGAGGIITEGTQAEISQREFDYLLRCFLISRQHDYPYFAANSLEAMAEHLLASKARRQLLADNQPALRFINPEGVEEDMLPIYLADNSLFIFRQYGDVYQIAGAYRTLASCHRATGDYESALFNLEEALSNSKIEQAPDLVASIREQLSVAYSAINDKPLSDYNRNIYIDLQEQTRQDRYLEARADMYDKTSSQLNLMMAAVIVAILFLVFMLWLFNHLHQKRKTGTGMEELLKPLCEWKEYNESQISSLQEKYENINEDYALNVVHIQNNERRNLENRAKVSLVNSIMPFIDRIMNEVERLKGDNITDGVKAERLAYIRELTDKINEYNDVLTHWIQLRQGELSLHIESFPLQPLFDIVAKGKMAFKLKGVELHVGDTAATVKADKILTLFMLNTLADNARKFTPAGGTVEIEAAEEPDYVEISVKDTGKGMSEEALRSIFEHKVYNGHGFGLMNCRGIIEKYRKISQIFRVCSLTAESEEGKGSRFCFRLPRGVVRTALLAFILGCPSVSKGDNAKLPMPDALLYKANAFADSAYFSNINGTYAKTLQFADSCRKYLNDYYSEMNPTGRLFMLRVGNMSLVAPEIKWFYDHLPTNYNVILDIRNESAVAALALHQWDVYAYNNKVYTQLFKEMSADNTLADYCRVMQQSQTNKTIAVILLILVLIMILPAYYILYYRHRLYYRFCVERILRINEILLSESEPDEKLRLIEPLSNEQYPEELQEIVRQIRQALNDAVSLYQQQFVNIELAEDERRRAEYEDNNLHVSNSVLDNCLSTLKHETMYYPSRIRQLIDENNRNIEALSEVVDYYRDIYSILSRQAMRQVERIKIHLTAIPVCDFIPPADVSLMILGDRNLLKYLFEIILRESKEKQLDITVHPVDDKYLRFTIKMQNLRLNTKQAQDLFVPAIEHIQYLLCRQIVRDHSEATNRRGCGILAELVEGITVIKITLPRYMNYGEL